MSTSPRRPRRPRTGAARAARALLAGLLVTALPAAGLLVAGPAAAAGAVCVGVVVARTPPASDDRCVRVPAGSTGLDVLVQRAKAAGRPSPRFSGDGQVCAIDGYPATGCGVPDGNGGYRYWSYWTKSPGASSWSYSRVGAGGRTVADGGMEGWAFQDGGAEQGTRPPERSHAQVCPASPSPAPKPSSAAPAPSRTAAAPPATRAPAPPSTPAAGAPAPRGAGTPRATASASSAGPAAGAASPSTAAQPTPAAVEGPASTGPSGSTAPSTQAAPTLTPTAGSGEPAGGGTGRTLLGLGLVGLLGAAGLVVARRRSG